MRIKPSLGLVVGPVNGTHWSQVLTTPNAYGIVEVSDSNGNAQEHGVRALSQIAEALNTETVSLRDLERKCDQFDQTYIRSLIVLVPVGKIIYIVVRGKGLVYVKRGSELASLMHSDGAISGEVKLHDTILLASDGFSNVLSREELSKLFDHLSPPEVAEKLTLLLHETIGGEGSAALVFGVSEFAEISQVSIEEEEESPQDSKPPTILEKSKLMPAHTVSESPIQKGKKLILRFTPKEWIGYLKEHPKQLTALIAVLCTLFFMLSVALGVMKQNGVKKNQKISAIIVDAQHALDEGVALLDLNPAKGRERLEEAKKLLEPLRETVSTRTIEGRKVLEVYDSINDNLTQALHITKIAPILYYDISLVKKSSVISYMARDLNDLVITDATTNTVYRMDVESKKAQIIAGGSEMKGTQYATVHGKKSYVLTDTGIFEISPGVAKPSLVIKKDPDWGTIQSMVSFGGNLYLLDVIKSRIWKYVATEKGFSERREYLNPDTLPDLTRTSSMAIDGSVFMGNQDGSILRFTQGKENTLLVKGVDPGFGASPIVYTSDDTKYIYVLDTKLSRIVVIDKDGMYVSQYQYAGMTPSQFTVFEDLKKIVLLVTGKLYTIDLK